MSAVKITVPIELKKTPEGYWLQVENREGHAASLHLNTITVDPLTATIFLAWAKDTMAAAFLKKRRRTGVKDVAGTEIAEGDIITRDYNEFYGRVSGVIKWDEEKAAFVAEGTFVDGGGWSTLNLQGANSWLIIGNIFNNPGFLVPAEKIK